MKRRKACGLCRRKPCRPVGACSRCTALYCAAHGGWDGTAWVCDTCARKGTARVLKAA